MKKFIISIFSFSLLSIIFIVLFSDTIIKKIFENILSNSLDRVVKIAEFDVGYLSEEINLKSIEIQNKNFPGKILIIDKASAQLDALSFYEETIIIDNILLDGVRVNYFFDITNKARNNFNSLKKTLNTKNRPASEPDSKKFLIKQFDIKNLNVTATSNELDITKKIKLNDMKFTNLGNAKGSKNYEILTREILDISYKEIKDKIASGMIDEEIIKDKVKEKLKSKFKKLLK